MLMRMIKAKTGIFLGSRTHGPDDPPFEVDDRRARFFVDNGAADYFTAVDEGAAIVRAVDPGPAKAHRAVAKRA
jgi:hypothetical protein